MNINYKLLFINNVFKIQHNKEIPKNGPINRIKNASKDTIPIAVGPRRQHSSRFHVTEKIELEKLVGFKGIYIIYLELLTNIYINK